jgi:nicotinamide-nucleotide amidase
MTEEENVVSDGGATGADEPGGPYIHGVGVDGLAIELILDLTFRGLSVAVAESLTGGLLTAKLIDPPGASAVVWGGVVAYNTELKHTLLGVDSSVLAVHGAVHPDVAARMAVGVREHCRVGGRPADIGIATTGAAGPDPQDGQPAGTVFVGISTPAGTRVTALALSGDRSEIRNTTVYESLLLLKNAVDDLGNK